MRKIRTFLNGCVLGVIVGLGLLESPAARAEHILRRPNIGEPDSIDPQKTLSGSSLAITRDLFTGLFALSVDGKPVPGIAMRWEVSPDRREWTFHLRPDARWSNGDALTAGDFVYGFRRLFDPETGTRYSSSLLRIVGAADFHDGKVADPTTLGVTAIDEHTLRIRLEAPLATMPLLLTAPSTVPLYRPAIERWGDSWTEPRHIVTNGPYILQTWIPQSKIILTRNPEFFDADTVKVGEVDWILSEDDNAARQRYRAGELDWATLTRTTLAWARHARPGQIHNVASNGIEVIVFNMVRGAWANDARIREAMNLAIDRETLLSTIDPIGEPAAYAVVPTMITGYTPQEYAWRSLSPEARKARARDLVEAAGFGPDHPLALTIIYTTSESSRHRLDAIVTMLHGIGVEATLENLEWKAFLDRTARHDFDLALCGQSHFYDDYGVKLGDFVSSAGERNLPAYRNPAFDVLVRDGDLADSTDTRRRLMEQAEAVLLADYPVIPIAQRIVNRLVNPTLRGGADRVENPQSRYLWFED